MTYDQWKTAYPPEWDKEDQTECKYCGEQCDDEFCDDSCEKGYLHDEGYYDEDED